MSVRMSVRPSVHMSVRLSPVLMSVRLLPLRKNRRGTQLIARPGLFFHFINHHTMWQNQVILRHKKIHIPTTSGVSEVSERANEWAQRRVRAKRAVWSKWTSERCEGTSKRTSKWPSIYVSILVFFRPLWSHLLSYILFLVDYFIPNLELVFKSQKSPPGIPLIQPQRGKLLYIHFKTLTPKTRQ